MKIKSIERIPIHLPFHESVAADMLRAITHRTAVTITKVRTDAGHVGLGDSLGHSPAVNEFVGRSVAEAAVQTDDDGLQMALHDALAKAEDVPLWRLLGRRVRHHVPFAYWTIDLAAPRWAEHVKRAASLGYLHYKFKARPWRDIIAQVEAVERVAPPGFRVAIDFNASLREAGRALEILTALERFEVVELFESPIPQGQLSGLRRLKRHLTRPIVCHFSGTAAHANPWPGFGGNFDPLVAAAQGLIDGFVLGGGDIVELRNVAAVAREAELPFWIQTVGTGLRAAWVAHAASVLETATLASLCAHDLWEDDLVKTPLPVCSSMVRVPDGPGLGVELDEDALERTRNLPPPEMPRRIHVVVYPDGRRHHYPNEQAIHDTFYRGDEVGYQPGIDYEILEDDGSKEYDRLWNRVQEAPVFES